MSAKIQYGKEEIKVYLDGEIDHHSASIIRASVDEAIKSKKPRKLLLDFGGVCFMDSSGIGLVMGRFKLLKTFGGKLFVENLSPQSYKLMKMAGLEALGELKQKETVK